MSLFNRSLTAAAASVAATAAEPISQEENPAPDAPTPMEPAPEGMPVPEEEPAAPAPVDPSKDPLDKVVGDDDGGEAAPEQQAAIVAEGAEQVAEVVQEAPVAQEAPVVQEGEAVALESATAVVPEEPAADATLVAEAPVEETPAAVEATPITAEAPVEEPALEAIETTVVAEEPVATEALAAAALSQAEADASLEAATPVQEEVVQEEAPVVQEAEVSQEEVVPEATPTTELPVQVEETPVAEATPALEMVEEVQPTENLGNITSESIPADTTLQAPAGGEVEDLQHLDRTIVAELDIPAITGKIRRSPSSKTAAVLVHSDRMNVVGRRTADLINGLQSLEMVLAFTKVAQAHQLSAPLVAAFRATPGFDAAVKNFPATALFNIVPEHASSANNQTGLESFNDTASSMTDDVKAKTQALVDAFKMVLDNLGTTVDNLRPQVEDDKAALDDSDVTDEVMATLPVFTLSNVAFTDILNKLDVNLRAVDIFNVDDLRAHPEKLPEQIDAISALVADIGDVLGLELGTYGLGEINKAEAYEPTNGDFGSKEITKSSLTFYLEHSLAILDVLKVIADRKDDVIDAVSAAVADVPEAVESNDVTYGCIEHVTLLSCYATLVTKLVREAIVTITMVLTAVDAVLDIDTGDVTEVEAVAE